jgi:hypothetical protein
MEFICILWNISHILVVHSYATEMYMCYAEMSFVARLT